MFTLGQQLCSVVNNFQSGDILHPQIVEAHSSTSFVWSATAAVVSQKAPEQFTLGQRLCSVANNFQSRDIPQQQHPQIVEAHLHIAPPTKESQFRPSLRLLTKKASTSLNLGLCYYKKYIFLSKLAVESFTTKIQKWVLFQFMFNICSSCL